MPHDAQASADAARAADAIVEPKRRRCRPVVSHQRLLATRQAAGEYGLAYGSLRDLVFRGLLPVVRFGDGKYARWYFDRADLDALIVRSKETVRG